MDDMEIDSIDTYDFRRARLSAALRWILNAAYGPSVPVELKEPLPLKDKDTVTAIYVNTGLVSLLINSRLYIQACTVLLPQVTSSWKQGESGHWAVIQGLSRIGVYVEDDSGQAITEAALVQTNPFHLTAHVSLIEAMMSAYVQTVATTDKVVQAVRVIGPFNASEDLPIDCEDALLVWMNKVALASAKHTQTLRLHQHAQTNHSSTVKISKRQLNEVTGVASAPLMEDVLKDISDGCSLATLISFYCPTHLNVSDIHTSEPVGIGDSLHNISLVKGFCDKYLPVRVFTFTYEDILYSTDTIKPSFLAFLTQLFHYFVIKPLDIVSPPVVSNNNNYSSGVKTILPPSTAAAHPSKRQVSPASTNQHVGGPQDLISDATKKSFQHASSDTLRLSKQSDFGSNPSLNTSNSSSKLLHKRFAHVADGVGMHDTLSPIVVRRSQSMGILNAPEPNQSLVAWESKSYYVDRSSKQPNRVSNGSTSLLSNVSFCEEAEEEELCALAPNNDLNVVKPVASFQRRQQKPRSTERPKSSCNMSNSYQKLLDRSNDLESPLKLFAQKHGFQLADKPAESTKTGQSLSAVDASISEFTKVTPRDDSETSPRQHASTDVRNGMPVTGRSYVVSTVQTAEGAHAAGIPVISDRVADSCTDALTSLVDDVNSDLSNQSPRLVSESPESTDQCPSPRSDERVRPVPDEHLESPIEPIAMSADNNNDGEGSVTSFAGLGLSKGSALQASVDMSAAVQLSGGLKQRYEQQKTTPAAEGKQSKKTTFSLNQTTWSDHAKSKVSSEPDSDSHSENSEASGPERKQFSDVKIKLEEKRKAMEKKKTMEEIERARDADNTSRQAFLKAVAKRTSHKGSDLPPAFSRNDISKSIENLQSKWQHDEASSAKRVAATTPAKTINVTDAAAALDNITEVSETMEVESPKVSLPAPTPSVEKTTPSVKERSSSIDMHEAPVELEQYGLDKLNASLSELRGEMKRLSNEQKRIEELQSVMNITRPQSRSTPHSKSESTLSQTLLTNHSPPPTNANSSVSDQTLRLSELEKSELSSSITQHPEDSNATSWTGNNFTQPNSHSMTESTDQPFILHEATSKKANRNVQKRETNSTQKEKSKKSTNQTPRSSNGFLSSSQLSRRKPSLKDEGGVSSTPSTPDQSTGGRKKWTSSGGPLFPGYDDDVTQPSSARKPATNDELHVFQPPQDLPQNNQRLGQTKRQPVRPQSGSPEDTPLREFRKSSSDGLEIRQLPGHRLPVELNTEEDTPMRNARVALGPEYEDTPLREMRQHQPLEQRAQPSYPSPMDTPMMGGHQFSPRHGDRPRGALSVDTSQVGGDFHNMSVDTPMRPTALHTGHYPTLDDTIDTPMRHMRLREDVDTPLRVSRRPQSMIEPYRREELLSSSIDTPIKEAMRNNQIFYSPPTRDHREITGGDDSALSLQPVPEVSSRHGTSTVTPLATSRHGTIVKDEPVQSESPARLVRAPYEFEPANERPAVSSYKLNTPYGNADNEIKPAETNISLSSAMDAIRNDMIRQNTSEPVANSNVPLGMISQPQAAEDSQPVGEYALPEGGNSALLPADGSLSHVSSNHSQAPSAGTHQEPRRPSAENEDRMSVQSYGSGSMDSGDATPRNTGKPKRATWDMSTPRGDLLNQPGVGFIVAEQTQLSEEELRKRKEKVMLMQLKRREEQELKKQQKAAELAVKAEAAKAKELEAERRKLEEKVKKEAILQQFQIKKAEEDLPPEMRAQFRQKQKRAGQRPASIHWAGSSVEDHSLRGSDNLDAATSFTVSMASGSNTHRRPFSPGNSSAAGNLSSRSKYSARGATFEPPPDEYTGPKLYVKPSSKQKSNRTIIINAVSHCCLAGVVNTDNKNKVLEEIARSDGKHFLILFRDGNQTYKAVYSYCPDSEECTKIHGQGPKYIKDDMCHRFYKYNSGGKKFTEVLSTKHLSVSIDAITIHNHLWHKKAVAAVRR